MKITIINGSPKGDYSVSLHYGLYLGKIRKDWNLEVFHVGQRILSLIKDQEKRSLIIESVKNSDLVLWCFPVYTFIVPWQIMTFLDVLLPVEREAFKDKYTAQIMTSMQFYDHTARDYMVSVLSERGMKVLPAFCVATEDLKSEEGRISLSGYAEQLTRKIVREAPVSRVYIPETGTISSFNIPEMANGEIHEGSGGYLILADRLPQSSNLSRMISHFRRNCSCETRIIYRDEIPGKGGCLGCLSCTFQGHCVYKDGFEEFHRQNILKAKGIIYALEVKEGWFHPEWKRLDDRCFYNGHRINQMGKPVGYLLSGNLSRYPHIRHILTARSEVGKLFLLDILSDEGIDSPVLEAQIKEMALLATETLTESYRSSVSFLGVGGMKVFRDLIFTMRGFMMEDHQFYKKHKLYDFPHKKRKAIVSGYLIGAMMKVPSVRKKAMEQMKEGMIAEYRKLLE